MTVTIEVPDEVAARLEAQAGQAFAGDTNAVAVAAIEHYLTTRELMDQLLLRPPVVVAEEPQFTIDPNALLEHVGAGDVAVQDVLTGNVTLPPQVIDEIRDAIGDADISDVLSGQVTVSTDAAATLPVEVLVPSTGVIVHEPPTSLPSGDEEERVAQVLAASSTTVDELESAAAQLARMRDRVEELRSR